RRNIIGTDKMRDLLAAHPYPHSSAEPPVTINVERFLRENIGGSQDSNTAPLYSLGHYPLRFQLCLFIKVSRGTWCIFIHDTLIRFPDHANAAQVAKVAYSVLAGGFIHIRGATDIDFM